MNQRIKSQAGLVGYVFILVLFAGLLAPALA